MKPGLVALAISAFAIGTTEFVVVGLLPEIGRDLNVSVPTAGLLITLYAFSITIATPIFTALTGRFDRRPLIISLMTVFALMNVFAALSTSYETLLISRVVMAIAHGVFFGVGAAAATSLVSKDRAGSPVATMMGGLTLAMVIGVPLGSWLGQSFGWRTPFFVVAVLAAISMLSLIVLLPRKIEHHVPASFISQFRVLGNPRLLRLWLFTVLAFGGTFTVFSYVAPLIETATGAGNATINIALVVFGVASAVGNYFAGRVADALGSIKAMAIFATGLLISIAVLPFTMHDLIPLMINLFVWGAFGFGIPPIMQSAVVTEAARFTPEFVATASGMNIAAFNLGISSGTFIGGLIVAGAGVESTPWGGVAMVVLALITVAFIATIRDRKAVLSDAVRI